MPDPANSKLLEFIVPGFLHGMGNALFAIQAQSQVLSLAGRGDVEEILSSCRNANAALDLLRRLAASDGGEPWVPAGPALREIFDLIRVGLRDTHLSLDAHPVTFEADELVRHGLFTRTVALAAAEIVSALPTGRRGALRIRWEEPRVLRLEFLGIAEQLPFNAGFGPAEEAVAAWLDGAGGKAVQVEGGLRLTFPEAASD